MKDDCNENKAKTRREAKQLRRLEVLMDVVFALMIWRLFQIMPRPSKSDWNPEAIKVFLSANVMGYVLVLVSLIIVIIYWIQNNTLFDNLERTDGRHTTLSILQLFCLLLFLYAIKLGMDVEAGVATRAIESITAALVGFVSAAGWGYAIKNRRLLSPDVTDQEAQRLRKRFFAEPVTAAITVPFAFVGPIIWEISWFLYPLMVKLFKRPSRKDKA